MDIFLDTQTVHNNETFEKKKQYPLQRYSIVLLLLQAILIYEFFIIKQLGITIAELLK